MSHSSFFLIFFLSKLSEPEIRFYILSAVCVFEGSGVSGLGFSVVVKSLRQINVYLCSLCSIFVVTVLMKKAHKQYIHRWCSGRKDVKIPVRKTELLFHWNAYTKNKHILTLRHILHRLLKFSYKKKGTKSLSCSLRHSSRVTLAPVKQDPHR